MTKIITVWLLLALTTVTAMAQQMAARIDLSGISDKIELTPLESSGGKINFGTWQSPENVNRYLTAEFKGARKTWTEGKISFTPQKEGRVLLWLLGPYVEGGKTTKGKPFGVRFDNVKINGTLLRNGDFESGENGWTIMRKSYLPAKIVTEDGGNQCVEVWHGDPAITSFLVQKNRLVEITFDFMSVGELSEDTRENAL